MEYVHQIVLSCVSQIDIPRAQKGEGKKEMLTIFDYF